MLVNFAKSYNLDIIQILFLEEKKLPVTLFCFFFFVIKQNQGSTLGAEVVFNFQLRQSKESFNSNSHTTISFKEHYFGIFSNLIANEFTNTPFPWSANMSYWDYPWKGLSQKCKVRSSQFKFPFQCEWSILRETSLKGQLDVLPSPDPPEGPKMENFNRRVSQSLACWMLNWKGLTLRRL